MNNLQAHIFAIATPFLASVSQILIKWQVNQFEEFPRGLFDKIMHLLEFMFRPWVMVAILSTFLGGVTWIMAMTKLDLSYAYPYVALTFIIVPLSGMYLFDEILSPGEIVGGGMVLIGIIIIMING